jgi:hypothetical protein
MEITTKIKQINSEFDDIYRITTENGLILDISEVKKPEIDSIIKYYINNNDYNNYNDYKGYTIMNGIVYNIHDNGILVSFGGLLGNIPLDEKIKNELSLNSITIVYCLQN